MSERTKSSISRDAVVDNLSQGLVERITGASLSSSFSAWPAYLHTVEDSIYVHPQHRGKGIGKVLLPPLIEQAKAQGMHAIVAGI